MRFGFHAYHAMSFLDLKNLNSWIVLRKARARYHLESFLLDILCTESYVITITY